MHMPGKRTGLIIDQLSGNAWSWNAVILLGKPLIPWAWASQLVRL